MNLNNLSTIQKIAKVWQLQLNLEYTNKKSNTRLSFKDIGSFCELLAANYNTDFVGCGSGGMGLDLMNYKTKKAVEVKSCCTIQNAICNNMVKDSKGNFVKCGTRFNDLFNDACPVCGSKNFKKMDDSRFGINADEFLKQYKEGFFENFTMCYISLVNENKQKHTITIKLERFKTEFSDDKIRAIQLKYFQNQKELGKKDHCNLLPYSFDFYKLCPEKIDDFNININYNDLNTNPQIIKCEFEKNLKVPLEKIPKKDIRDFTSLETYDQETKTADCKDFTLHLDYKKKNLGKERGDTRNKIYSFTKK